MTHSVALDMLQSTSLLIIPLFGAKNEDTLKIEGLGLVGYRRDCIEQDPDRIA